jgi:hypothetical protein
MGKLICPPELSGNPTSSHLAAKQEELAKEMMNLALQNIFVHTSKGFLTCGNILGQADGFISPPKEAVLQIFKHSSLPSAGFEPMKLVSMTGTLTISQPKTTFRYGQCYYDRLLGNVDLD